MSHSYYKNQFNLPWVPNRRVFNYKVMDMSIIQKYSSHLYKTSINMLLIPERKILFKECANVAKLQANIAIKKMISSYDNKGDK